MYVEDALLALLREYGADKQAEMVLRADLTELDLGGFRIGDDGAEIVADFLKDNETVRYVWLYNCTIGLSGAKSIAEALRSDETVELLDLESNPFGDEGAEALIDAFNENVFMERLHVSHVAPRIQAAIKYLTRTRNAILIPPAVRRASLYLIAIRRTANYDGMGRIGIFPKEIVKMIAMEVFATRKDPIWIEAAENSASAAPYKVWSEDWTNDSDSN